MSSADQARRQLAELMLRRELAAERERAVIRPRPRPAAAAPLSFAQERMWLLERLAPGSVAYNEVSAFRVRGRLEPELLQRSLDDIVARHEILRSVVSTVDDRPVQLVLPRAPLELQFSTFTALPPAEREPAALREIRAAAAEPFALDRPPLLRVRLLELAADDQLLGFVMHHIATDGWALRILLHELVSGYLAYRDGREPHPPALPVQYADYAYWQRRQFESGAFAGQLDYWRTQLGTAPQVLELPTDRPRPDRERHGGAEHHFAVPAELVRRLDQLGQQTGATLFMTLLAAYAVLLARYSGDDDLVVGTPSANRSRAEVEGLIGCFLNMLVIRADLSGRPTFRELLRAVRATVLTAFEHQDIPLEHLVEELNPVRAGGMNPLFQVIFVLHNQPIVPPELPGLAVTPVSGLDETAKVDLSLALVQGPTGLTGQLLYSTDLFDASRVARLAEHLRLLLEAVAEDPDRPVHALPMLTPAELQVIQNHWYPNETVEVPGLRLLARGNPEAVAVVDGAQELTYAELDRRAEHLAQRLRRRGAGGGWVVVCLDRSADLVVALVAVLKAGAAYLAVPPATPLSELSETMADSSAAVLLTARRHTRRLAPLESLLVVDDEDSDGPAVVAREAVPAAAAYALPGSRVIVEHRNLIALFTALQPWLSGAEPDTWTLSQSPGAPAFGWELWGALAHGGRLVVVPPAVARAPDRLQRFRRDQRVSVVVQTEPGAEIPGVRLVLRFADRPVELVGGQLGLFGPVEAGCCVEVQDSGQVPGVGTLVVDRELRPVPLGVAGELVVTGPGIGPGRLGRPAEEFIADPLGSARRCVRTGELVRRTAAGSLEYLGQIADLVRVDGFRVDPRQVETHLRAHPQVRDAAVELTADGRLTAKLVPAGAPPPASTLRAFLRTWLSEHQVPAEFRYVERLSGAAAAGQGSSR